MPGETERHRTPISEVDYSAESMTDSCNCVPDEMKWWILVRAKWHRTETSARVGKLTLRKQELLLATRSNDLESSSCPRSDTNDLSR
jgi:hypothetical protein